MGLRQVSLRLPACPSDLAAVIASLPGLASAELSFESVPCAESWPHLAALGARLRTLSVTVCCPAPTEEEGERQEGLAEGLQALAPTARLEVSLCTDAERPDEAARLQGLGTLPVAALYIEQPRFHTSAPARVPAVVWDNGWRHLTRLCLSDADLTAVDDAASASHRSPGRVGANLSSLQRLGFERCSTKAGCFPVALCSLGQLTYLVRAGGSRAAACAAAARAAGAQLRHALKGCAGLVPARQPRSSFCHASGC